MSRKLKTLTEEEFQADLADGKLIRIVDDHGMATPAGSGPAAEARRVRAEPEISLPAGEAGCRGGRSPERSAGARP